MPIPVTEIGPEPQSPNAVEYRVRMRDGIRLATDVYLPDGWTEGPVVLVRLPYDKNSRYVFMDRVAARFNARGYALVVQDVRGKYRSEGTTVSLIHETYDGYDTIEWIVNQTWSNGKVGMFGDSYYGFTQWAAVASEHPALRAIVPRVTAADLGVHSWPNSAPGTTRRLDALWRAVYLSQVWVQNHSYDFVPDFSLRPVSAMFDDIFASLGQRSAYLDMSKTTSASVRIFPGPHPFDVKPLPVLHVVGWFDNLKCVSMGDYLTLASRPAWSPLQYLWVDSMDHENYRLPNLPIGEANDHGVNDDALDRILPTYVDPAADFFDVFLREIAPAASLPRVRWHLSHGPKDEMLTAESWPPPGVTTTPLYLGNAAEAVRSEHGGDLLPTPAAESSVTWTHDPLDPVPSVVANSFAMLFEYPDEREIGGRADVLTFTGHPTTEALDLVGPITLDLRLSSTAPTTDVVAKLFDVSAEGAAHIIAWGDAQVDTAADVPAFTVDLGQVAYRLRPGHALRLQLSSSEFPAFVVNPGTAAPAWTAAETKPSEQTLTTSPEQVVLRISTRR